MSKNLKWKCLDCGTKYNAPEGSTPPGIKWSDGHECKPVLVDNYKSIAEKIVTIVNSSENNYDSIEEVQEVLINMHN